MSRQDSDRVLGETAIIMKIHRHTQVYTGIHRYRQVMLYHVFAGLINGTAYINMNMNMLRSACSVERESALCHYHEWNS